MAGSLNRFWWNFSVKPKHPEWPMPDGKGFPREADAAVKACVGYEFMVDLTIFKNDGGGTQYSFLEAMDAGSVPVMTKDWCSYKGVAHHFGYQVEDKEELINFLKDDTRSKSVISDYRRANYSYLNTMHDPVKVAATYCEFLGVSSSIPKV